MENKEKMNFYVTTAIAYVNAAPHIGFALECVQADVFARWKKLQGHRVFFSTGTDEHGAKIAKTAEQQGREIKDIVKENAQKFKDLTKSLNLSNDTFIQTSDQKRHWPATQKIWKIIQEKDKNLPEDQKTIYKDTYKGLYCVGCEAYITEKDLIDGKCPIHNTEPEILEEENYFFRLSKYKDWLKVIFNKGIISVTPRHRKEEIINMIEGLQNVSISRPSSSLSWGVPVPNDDSQTMYVWFEALINYLSALDFSGDEENFKQFWRREEGDTRTWKIHFIGKDILKFHAVLWPAILEATGLPLCNEIFVHGYIMSHGKKMSKSVGNVVDPFELIERFNADMVRYYLLSEISSTEDGNYTEENFYWKCNADLANGIGNVVSRVTNLIESNKYEFKENSIKEMIVSGEIIKKANSRIMVAQAVGPTAERSIENYVFKVAMEWFGKFLNSEDFSCATGAVMSISNLIDGIFGEYHPWELVKTNPEMAKKVLHNCLEAIRIMTYMLWPFMPETADRIFWKLGFRTDEDEFKSKYLTENIRKIKLEKELKWGSMSFKDVQKGEVLFKKIEFEFDGSGGRFKRIK